MRNLKKIIAVVVTLVMLFAVASVSASAATAPKFALYGRSEAGFTDVSADETPEYYELEVYLENGDEVGAIEGVITYDPTIFQYVATASELGDALDNGSNTMANSIELVEEGKLKFVGISNTSGTWFVLKFTVGGAGSTSFSLSAKAANATGTAYLDVQANGSAATITDEDLINVKGAAILVNENSAVTQDLTFKVEIDDTLVADYVEEYGEISEVGVLMMFTKRLAQGRRELTLALGNAEGLVVAKKATADANDFTVDLKNIKENAMGVNISARAYISFTKDDTTTTIYSKNFDNAMETNAGYGRETVIGVALDAIIAGEYKCDDTARVEEILAIANEALSTHKLTGDNRTKVLQFIGECYDSTAANQ